MIDAVVGHEKLARIVESYSTGSRRQIDYDIAHLAQTIRELRVDDARRAARIVMSAQMLDGSVHDAIVARIADAVRDLA